MMGTRADFYVGRGEDAEWIGSISWDGYPEGVAPSVFHATTEDAYRGAVGLFLAERRDATYPTEPWPWPWDDSLTTDYAYAFDGGAVWASRFGHEWFRVDPNDEEFGEVDTGAVKAAVFPNMAERRGSRDHVMGRSGLIVFSPASGPAAPDTFGLSDPAQTPAASDGD